jgi:sec-independent protein translocase protein TatB
MFDIGWAELVVIGVVALIVIGPEDLPEMFRTLGRFTAKIRTMAREFQRAMETAADDSGVKDVARDLKSMTSPQSLGLNAMKDAAAKFEKWDPLKPKPAAPSTPVPAANEAAAPVIPAAAPPVMGPATQALADAKAERKAIAAEAAEKLRAVGKPKATVAAKPAAKKRPALTPAAEAVPVKTPRAPRAKPKGDA